MPTTSSREHSIYRITLLGSAGNVLLLIFKFAAGILGGSAAMIADAVHSLSDFATDIVVLLFVRLSGRPSDSDHDFGHGKYETLATVIVGLMLMAVGIGVLWNGAEAIYRSINGELLPQPGNIALIAALVSIVVKELLYQATVRVGRFTGSQAVVANAWHHRSDALSSIGTAVGIGGAILLGEKWAVLDPIAAVVVSVFIIRTAWQLTKQSAGELLEQSLPADMEREIVDIVACEPMTSEVHHLRTRRIGSHIAIEMHLRMPGDISLYESHQHATNIEQKLRKRFGASTHIGLHVEPLKINGKYVAPKNK